MDRLVHWGANVLAACVILAVMAAAGLWSARASFWSDRRKAYGADSCQQYLDSAAGAAKWAEEYARRPLLVSDSAVVRARAEIAKAWAAVALACRTGR